MVARIIASCYLKALSKGVLKVMSKLGISTIASYTGAQVFEALGLAHDLVDEYFTGTVSRLGGIGLDVLATEAEARQVYDHIVAKGDYPGLERLVAQLGVESGSFQLVVKQFAERFFAGWGGYPIVGSPEQVVDKLAELSRIGIDGFTAGWLDYAAELEYFGARVEDPRFCGVFVLVDSRHPGLEADRQAWNWLCRLGVSRHAVATKVDKLTQSERKRHLGELERLYSGPVTPVSAETGEGLDALWKKIASLTTTARP